MSSTKNLRSWWLGVLAALSLAFVTSLPQLYLCYSRGSDWNGSFAYLDTDELAYNAYENSIINGHPRRNDPYNGTDAQKFETLFSIQFIPPYLLAAIAKLFNLSASKTFVFLSPFVVIASSLIIFRLVKDTTNNVTLAVVSSIVVLTLGTLAVNNHALAFVPFLRRYVPALPFPVCLGFFLLAWQAVTHRKTYSVVGAALSFVVLVYSYFFLWTAAAAWCGLLLVLWFIARPADRAQIFKLTVAAVITSLVALLPYFWLVSHRASTMDEAQVLQRTRAPDLLRTPELIGFAILILVTWLSATRKIDWREPASLLVISLASAPLVILNHQIITGRSLQPFHYTQFITNYMVTIAGVILLGIAWKRMPRLVPVTLGLGCFVLTALLAGNVARSTLAANVELDQKREVALTIEHEQNDRVVFASDALMTMLIPTEARNPMLWSRYSYIFGDITPAQRKQNYFKYLYYSGFDEQKFLHAMNYDFTSRVEVFGAERTNPSLTVSHQEITSEELQLAYQEYVDYCSRFSRGDALSPTLGYAIVLTNVDLTNLDRWYSRDSGKRVGAFIIYKVSPK